MVIIFCDISGVLNTVSVDSFQQESAIDRSLVSNLNKLILQHGAKLVLTTPWEEQSDFFSLAKILYQEGLIPYSVMSALPKGMDKQSGIMTWLQVHESHVQNFIILDSGLEEIKKTPLNKKFIQTKTDAGLTQNALDKANKKLAT